MQIAILSDIHSNVFALNAVKADMLSQGIEKAVLLGDLFGYYPWATETFRSLKEIDLVASIKGNHDVLVEQLTQVEENSPLYFEIAVANQTQLRLGAPEALEWLNELTLESSFTIDGRNVRICHGTPDDPLEGRYYPDNQNEYDWFPKNNSILMMGHTHHPIIKEFLGGVLFNPGSVGQPRDGNVNACYGIVDLESNRFSHRRVKYDVKKTAALLEDMAWNPYTIRALLKNHKGKLT